MRKGFAITDPMGSVLVVASSREALDKAVEQYPLFGIGTEVIELELNDEPLTEKGQETVDEIRRVMEERQITDLRFDKMPAWYAMSADECAEFILKLINIDEDACEILDFGDRTRANNDN